MRPSPLFKLALPITAAAIASNSYLIPAIGSAVPSLLINIMPAKADRNPEIAKNLTLHKFMLTPKSLETTSFPQILYAYCSSFVYLRKNHNYTSTYTNNSGSNLNLLVRYS